MSDSERELGKLGAFISSQSLMIGTIADGGTVSQVRLGAALEASEGALKSAVQTIQSQATRIQELEARVKELRSRQAESFNRQFLDHFDDYEVWDFGDDAKLRVDDWVRLDYQDGNGNDYNDGVGKIVLHHVYGTPDMIMNIGFEEDGEVYGDYVGFPHPYNHIARISEKSARAALADAKQV